MSAHLRSGSGAVAIALQYKSNLSYSYLDLGSVETQSKNYFELGFVKTQRNNYFDLGSVKTQNSKYLLLGSLSSQKSEYFKHPVLYNTDKYQAGLRTRSSGGYILPLPVYKH